MTTSNYYITHAPATVNRNADQPGNPRANLTDQPSQPPQFPHLTRFGNSGQGRRRAALDAYHLAMRRYTGRQPIPGTQPCRYYTLEQSRIGGIRSGVPRRFQARAQHEEGRSLRIQGRSLQGIARVVGYHASTVSRISNGLIPYRLPFPHPAPRGGFSPGHAGFRVVGNQRRFQQVEPEDVHRRWRATP